MELVLVIAALGVIVVTSLFKVVELSTKAKQAIALAVSVVGGAITAWATGQFDGVTDVATIVTLVYGLAQGLYQFIFDQGRVLNVVDAALENFRVSKPEDTEVDPAHEDSE